MAAQYQPRPVALVVHPNVATLAAYQHAFTDAGFTTILARDLPTALLAVTQHYVEVAVICSRIAEEGDGWALGGVVRQAFPRAFVTVIAPDTSVRALQAAINNGLNDVYENSVAPDAVVQAVVSWRRGATSSPNHPPGSPKVQ